MPTASDLVTDLPADFETFGQAVATSMADLLGGTTGQVLAKASNTDMDFSWVAQDDSNAIQNAIVDAKGDLIAASAADTPARLAVGNNGETLVADSSTSTGLRYTAGTVQENPLINSAFQIWQRGTSFTMTGGVSAYTADRWSALRNVAGLTVSRQTTSDTTNLPFIQYCARLQRTAGNTASDSMYLLQNMETLNAIPFAGKTVTWSFYARAGANYSGTTTTYFLTGTGTDQNAFSGFTGQATAFSGSATLTTTWQRFTFTGTVAATATEIAPRIDWNPSGTAGANDYIEVTGAQIDIGSVALPYRTYAGTIQGELSACQRYYVQFNSADNVYTNFGTGQAISTTAALIIIPLPVPLRSTPSFSYTADIGLNTSNNGSINNVTGLTLNVTSKITPRLSATGSSGLAAGNVTLLGANNSSAAKLEFSSEL
jgi:hypothetical protein